MALAAVTYGAAYGQSEQNTNSATHVSRDQAVNDACKAFATAVALWAATIDAALQVCLKSHPQDAAYANLTAATTALTTAANTFKTATTV